MAYNVSRARRIFVKDLNKGLTCRLCTGYLIDATTLTECNHSFCRGCILRYFESCKTGCPDPECKKKTQITFRADPQLQAIVYKTVPGLYTREMQRREDFYRSTGVRASSSCSDDSVLERERDMIDQDEMVASFVGDKTQFFGPEDSISLSLEYYQQRLDRTGLDSDKSKDKPNLASEDAAAASDKHRLNGSKDSGECNSGGDTSGGGAVAGGGNSEGGNTEQQKCEAGGAGVGVEKRFLQCPAAVPVQHLQKFIRMKFALTVNHRVDIIYEGEVLPDNFSLMDVAYTFNWKRAKPMRFFYRIFTPMKIQPIKIVTSTLSTGGKQLQIVPVKHEVKAPPPPPPPLPPPPPPPPASSSAPPKAQEAPAKKVVQEEKGTTEEKERLLAHLQLQSRAKSQQDHPSSHHHQQQHHHHHHHHHTPAPKPLQDCVFDYEEPDKEEIKRFAEIRDREWALQKKLDEEYHHHFSKKRKKNKHSKSDFVYKKRKLHAEITNKEEDLKLKVKLTHNNGHKHKHHRSNSSTPELSSKEKLLQMRQVRHKHVSSEDKNVQTSSKEVEEKKEKPHPGLTMRISTVDDKKELRAAMKSPPPPKEPQQQWGNKVPTVQIERNEQTELQAKKTFLKTFQSYAEKYKNIEKKEVKPMPKPPQVTPAQSQLERKIANLQQRCTIETKQIEKKPTPPNPPKLLSTTQYPPGFTVSKVENNKRPAETDEKDKEKRPSLEITLINPQPSSDLPKTAKRPPPPTIPLERIKKSINSLKSGLSIIPKEKLELGPLDLSKKEEVLSKPLNGFKVNNNSSMSNLQMLSKVATEHPTLNKMGGLQPPKPRPQLPNIPTLMKIPNLAKLPKLTEINKAQFRMSSPQIRNLRPNQNQNIRNIPNPSLLIRQQNQNRLNSLNTSKEVAARAANPEKITNNNTTSIAASSTEIKLIDKEIKV